MEIAKIREKKKTNMDTYKKDTGNTWIKTFKFEAEN